MRPFKFIKWLFYMTLINLMMMQLAKLLGPADSPPPSLAIKYIYKYISLLKNIH